MRSNFSIWWFCLFSVRGERQQKCWLCIIKGANTWGGAVGSGLGVGSVCGRGLVEGSHPPGNDAPFVTHGRGIAAGKPTQLAEVSLTHSLGSSPQPLEHFKSHPPTSWHTSLASLTLWPHTHQKEKGTEPSGGATAIGKASSRLPCPCPMLSCSSPAVPRGREGPRHPLKSPAPVPDLWLVAHSQTLQALLLPPSGRCRNCSAHLVYPKTAGLMGSQEQNGPPFCSCPSHRCSVHRM